jgi:hypothetical protein
MLEVIDTNADNQTARADSVRDSVSMWKHVQPKNAGVHHFNDNTRRHFFEWEHIKDASGLFFHGAVIPLNLWDVFSFGNNIHVYFHLG